jgi:1-acylglycerone phosphate reductase
MTCEGYSSPLDADLVNSKQMFEVNLFGRAAVTQAFAPLLISSKGRVINIGSIAAYYPSVWQGMYGASCAAVHQWSDVLRIELKPFGVTIILVRPSILLPFPFPFLSGFANR